MMLGFGRKGPARSAPHLPERPVLDLSGPRLRRAFADLVASAEPTGGVERYVTALTLKASLFEELLGKAHRVTLSETEFLDLAAFVTPVRRRIGAWLAENPFELLRGRIVRLMEGQPDTADADQRLAAFVSAFPADKTHCWPRDLAAEMLHYTAPGRYPLMTRWVWDARVGTGALREIWHAEDADAAEIPVPDKLATFAMLTAELEGFLGDLGVFRDLPFYTDLLLAHVYAGYINDRGSQYLRAEFTAQGDPMLHTRRMLGLDAVDTATGRTRLRLIDGTAHVLGDLPALDAPEVSDANP